MENYYTNKLSAERLKYCYDIAPERIKQYLDAEIDHVLQRIFHNDLILELGCGYGRVLPYITQKSGLVVGIDISFSSLLLGKKLFSNITNCFFMKMDAIQLAFKDNSFDAVICIQNGISAFHVDQKKLISEGIRVAKKGATILFSSYSDKFWKYRLEWFELQAADGLLGEIDYEKTKNGVITCKDGFTATTVSQDQFRSLTSEFKIDINIIEINESSLFCEIIKLQ